FGEHIELICGSGLFDEFDTTVDELRYVAQRGEAVPAGVDVDTESDLAAERLDDLDDAIGIDCRVERAHLELEGVVQALLTLVGDLLDDLLERRGTERPPHVDAGPEGTAEQRRDRHTQRASPRVVHRDVDGGLRESRVGDDALDIDHDAADLVDSAPDDVGPDVAVDDLLHRLDRFAAPPRSARHDALTVTGDATLGGHRDEQDRLRFGGGGGELVGSDQRYVDDRRGDGGDLQIGVGHRNCSQSDRGVTRDTLLLHSAR